MARRVNGPPQRNVAPSTTRSGPTKPGCPVHGGEMAFNPSVMAWTCVVDPCSMVAYPREDFDAGKGKPHVGEGILEIVKHGPRWYLRAPDNNVMIDVTDYLNRASDGTDKAGAFYDVSLRLRNITVVGEDN